MSRITNSLLLLASSFIGIGVSAPVMALTTIPFSSDTTINSAVVLVDDTIYQSTNGSSLTFDSTVDGAFSLTVTTTGAVTFDSAVGQNMPLSGLSVSTGSAFYAPPLWIAGPLDITTGDSITLDNVLAASSVTLDAQASIIQSGGFIFAESLSGSSLASTTLDQNDNAICSLHDFRANGFSLNNSQTLVVTGSINGGFATAIRTRAGDLVIHGNIKANSVTLSNHGGDIFNDGNINATGSHGGSVRLLSDQDVTITSGTIDASGTYGGGSIRVGGGWQGGEGLQTSAVSYIGPDATLNADATRFGNGGSVVVWGNKGNNFYGSISARGGAFGGNGGQVETSSHDGLNVQGSVEASAPHGLGGTWLLDPYDVTIDAGPISGTAWVNPYDPIATSHINASSINGAFSTSGNTNVFVFTNTAANGADTGNITLNAPILAAGAGSLYLKAVGSVILNSSITAESAAKPLNVYLWANYGGGASDLAYTSNVNCALCNVSIGSASNASIVTDDGSVYIQTGDSLHAGGELQLGSSATITGSINTGGGDLNVISSGVVQQATGASILTVGGTSPFDVGTGAITLTNAGNDFIGAVTLTGGTTQITDKNALTLGTLATGDLTVTSGGALNLGSGQVSGNLVADSSGGNGNVTQDTTPANKLIVTGTGNVTAGTGTITLKNANNDFQGALSLSGGTTKITDVNALTLGTLATGDLTVTSGGALNLGGGQVSGVLNATAEGDITQNAALGVTGASVFTMLGGAHSILLGTKNNDFNGQSITLNVGGGGSIVTFALKDTDTSALFPILNAAPTNLVLDYTAASITLPTFSLAGSLNLTAGGGITINGDVTTGGTQTYASAVTLGGNDTLQGTDISLAGGVIGGGYGLTITGNTTLGTVSGLTSLSVSGTSLLNGNVTTTGAQTYTGAVMLGGDATLASTANGAIDFASTLDGAHNLKITTGGATTFAGEIGSTAALSKLDVTAGTFSANALNVSGSLLVKTTTGAITQGTGIFQVSGTSAFNAGSNAITLIEPNAFGGAVNLTGGTTQITNVNALTLGTLATGNLTVTSGGALNLGSGTVVGALAATSNNGAISQSGALTVNGTSTINAGTGAITLTSFNNDFIGAVALTGGTTQIADKNSLTLGTLQTGALTADSTGALNLGSGTVGGNLAATSNNGAISEGGALTVNGTSLINAGTGAITLASPGTSFGGQVSASGSAVSIANSVPLALGTVASSGALALTATGVTNNVSLVFGNGVTAGNVTGNYSQISAAALSLHATASTSDQLAISGTATLGGTLNVAFASAPSVGQSFTVLSSTGARSNTFATVNVTGLAAGTQAQTVYNSNNVQLKIEGTPATHFSLSAPTPVTAGTNASGLTVTALDASNNSTTGYTGTVHFTSTDGSAVLPADATLTNGTGSFNFTLNTAGSQIISATDTATSSITGASNAIVVNVGTQTISFTSTPPTHPLVGASYTVTATASSGLTVAFSIDAASTAGACTISAATVTFTSIGTCIIDADQAGDASFTAAPQAQQSIAVAAAPVPTPMLDRWALVLLTGLLGLFGFTRTRRA